MLTMYWIYFHPNKVAEFLTKKKKKLSYVVECVIWYLSLLYEPITFSPSLTHYCVDNWRQVVDFCLLLDFFLVFIIYLIYL